MVLDNVREPLPGGLAIFDHDYVMGEVMGDVVGCRADWECVFVQVPCEEGWGKVHCLVYFCLDR